MNLSLLKNNIQKKTAKIAVIGLGYVGLPVACEFARVGFDVLGIDILADRVERINRGESPIEGDEPGLTGLLKSVIKKGNLHASLDYQELSDRDIVLIDVETPVDENHQPRYKALRMALQDLGPIMKDGVLVIVESTVAPRTMNDIVKPLMEKSSGKQVSKEFFLGNCPERVMPGKLLTNLRTVSRVVGGMNQETAEVMVELYRHVPRRLPVPPVHGAVVRVSAQRPPASRPLHRAVAARSRRRVPGATVVAGAGRRAQGRAAHAGNGRDRTRPAAGAGDPRARRRAGAGHRDDRRPDLGAA